MIIVSDTSPICYLLLLELIELLPQLYHQVVIPQAVANELSAPHAPLVVQNWIRNPPEWVTIQIINPTFDLILEDLDLGEKEAIILAEQLAADLIILDDKLARRIARSRGLEIIGLLGILMAAKKCGLVSSIKPSIDHLVNVTDFWVSPSLYNQVLQIVGE